MTSDSGLIVHQGHHATSVPRFTDSLRVVSWNVKFGLEIEAASIELTDNPDLKSADIVLLQEMDEIGTAKLAEQLSLDFVYATPGTHRQSGRNFGNAILARWPLGEPEAIRLPHKAGLRGQPRVLLRTQVFVGAGSIDVCSVHTEVPSMSSAKRLRQFDEITASIARRPVDRFVVGGDFNTVSARGIQALSERMLAVGAVRVSNGAGSTLRRGGQEFTLDHIFARGFEPISAGVAAQCAASDHRPLWVILRIDEHEGLTKPEHLEC